MRLLCRLGIHRWRFILCHENCAVWCSTLCCARCSRCGSAPPWKWYVSPRYEEVEADSVRST